MNKLNNVELNAVLYYADYLSLLSTGVPVTDTCKYFFIYDAPINSACVVGNKPIYDENNKYYKQSLEEYTIIRSKFGDVGVMSFIDNICSLRACGKVSGEDMLRRIHQYDLKKEKIDAINKYRSYMKNLNYKHTIKDDEGKSIRATCSKYVAHYEEANRLGTRPELSKSDDEINA